LIYTTSCREVKDKEMVKEEIKRVNIGGASLRECSNREISPRVSYPFPKGERESNQRHGNAEKEQKHRNVDKN
jgi:hypothetical protein